MRVCGSGDVCSSVCGSGGACGSRTSQHEFGLWSAICAAHCATSALVARCLEAETTRVFTKNSRSSKKHCTCPTGVQATDVFMTVSFLEDGKKQKESLGGEDNANGCQ